MSKTKFITDLYEGIGNSKAAKETIRKLKKAVSDGVIDIKKFNSIVKNARTRKNPLSSIKNSANKIGQAANKAPTVVPKTAPDLAGLAKTPTNLGLLPTNVRKQLSNASSLDRAEKILQKAGLSATLATLVALGIAKFSGGDKKETSTTTSGKDRANKPLLPIGQNKAGEKGTSTVSEEQRVEASKAAKERAKKRKIDSLGQNTGKLSKPPVPKEKPEPPKKQKEMDDKKFDRQKIRESEAKASKKAKRDNILKGEGERQQGQIPKKKAKKEGRFSQGKKTIKTPFGNLVADSTDEGMSKFMGTKDEIRQQMEDEEMNFRKGGMARAKAFGKGGTYKSPKKNYTNGINMRYGGATKRSKGY